tara:strand:- start:5976 stop:6545 length:570 start_codon:yes stop_codon:yes gene_type:complete
MEKLYLNGKQLDKLIIEAEESRSQGFSREPEIFEFLTYLKIERYNDNDDDLSLVNENVYEDAYKEFQKYKKLLDEKIPSLDFTKDDSTEDILEVAGTINLILFTSNEELYLSNRDGENEYESKYESLMEIVGLFRNQFEDIFMKIGIVFEAWASFYELETTYNEQDIIKEYQLLDFKEIERILKLFQDD